MALAIACSFVSTFACSSNQLSPSPVRGPLNWENEPAGFTPLTDWALDQSLPTSGDVQIPGSNGWKIVNNGSVGRSSGWVALAPDSSAPLSPSTVYDFVYPAGMVEGYAPATIYYNAINKSEVYVGFWWKPSGPTFDFGSNGQKIAFLFNGGGGAGGQQFIIMRTDRKLWVLPEYAGDVRWRGPNVNATEITLGVWHRIEWYSNVASGEMRFYLDGVLQGTYSDVRNSRPFDMFQFSPTWGGCCVRPKSQTDHYWFDHARISVR